MENLLQAVCFVEKVAALGGRSFQFFIATNYDLAV